MAIVNYVEHALTFECQGEVLVGVLAVPDRKHHVGVLIVVGGPQYRVGSHRQFLQMARALAREGVAAFRFDYRGMGDGHGETRSFEDTSPDIAAAIAAFLVRCPDVDRIVLWGLCDGASAALLYWNATRDPLIAGMVLLNPWARSEVGLARTHIKHYYGRHLLEKEFWIKFLRGKVGVIGAIRTFAGNLMLARMAGRHDSTPEVMIFQDRMAEGLRLFRGPVLLILSGRDLTAKEFLEYANSSPRWSGLLARADIVRQDYSEADHTFSSATWSRDIETRTLHWIQQSFQ